MLIKTNIDYHITDLFLRNILITVFQYDWFPLESYAFYFMHLKHCIEKGSLAFTGLSEDQIRDLVGSKNTWLNNYSNIVSAGLVM